jgi:hypothetical protein
MLPLSQDSKNCSSGASVESVEQPCDLTALALQFGLERGAVHSQDSSSCALDAGYSGLRWAGNVDGVAQRNARRGPDLRPARAVRAVWSAV